MTDKLREYGVVNASKFKTGTELHRSIDVNVMDPLDFQDFESFISEYDDDCFISMDDEILTQVVPKDEILTQDGQQHETLASAVPKDETLTHGAPESALTDPEVRMTQEVDDEVFSDDDIFPDMNDDILEKQKADSDDAFHGSIAEGLLLPDMTNLQFTEVVGVAKGLKHERGIVNASSRYGMAKEASVDYNCTVLYGIDSRFLSPSETNMRFKTELAAENVFRCARQENDMGTVSSSYGKSGEPNVDFGDAVQSSVGETLLADDTKTECTSVRNFSIATKDNIEEREIEKVASINVINDASPGIVPESDDETFCCIDENLLSPEKIKPVGGSKENDSPTDSDSDEEFFTCIVEKALSPEKSNKAVPGGDELKNRETLKGTFLLDDIKEKDALPNYFDSGDEFFSSIDDKILSPKKSKIIAGGTENLKNREAVKGALFLDDFKQRDALSSDLVSDDELFSSIDEELLSPEKLKKVAPRTENLKNLEAVKGALLLDDVSLRDASSNDFVSDDELFSSIDEKMLSPESQRKLPQEHKT